MLANQLSHVVNFVLVHQKSCRIFCRIFVASCRILSHATKMLVAFLSHFCRIFVKTQSFMCETYVHFLVCFWTMTSNIYCIEGCGELRYLSYPRCMEHHKRYKNNASFLGRKKEILPPPPTPLSLFYPSSSYATQPPVLGDSFNSPPSVNEQQPVRYLIPAFTPQSLIVYISSSLLS